MYFCFFLVLWLIRFSSDILPTWQYLSYQLQRQVLEENLLHNSIMIMQKKSAHFEEGTIQSAWSMFDKWRARASLSSHREWIQFAARSDHLLDPETPLCDLEFISYPLKEDTSVVAIHSGHLE